MVKSDPARSHFPLRLRPYGGSDLNALIDLWYASWRSIGLTSPVVTRDDLARRIPDDLSRRWTVTVAAIDARLVGFLALCLAEQRLDQLFVAPEAHGCGVGSALFEAARQQAPEGFWLSTHVDNHRAQAFYARKGMTLDQAHAAAGGDKRVYVWTPTDR